MGALCIVFTENAIGSGVDSLLSGYTGGLTGSLLSMKRHSAYGLPVSCSDCP